jgi:hypothetical protein
VRFFTAKWSDAKYEYKTIYPNRRPELQQREPFLLVLVPKVSTPLSIHTPQRRICPVSVASSTVTHGNR